MTGIKSSFNFTCLCFGLPLTMAIVYGAEVFSPLTIRSLAQSQQVSISQGLITNWGAYEPDPNIGQPDRRESGASRGNCIEKSEHNQKKPIALLPDSKFGVTLEEYPTFLVYLPPIKTDTKPQMEFSLLSDNNQPIATTKLPLDGSHGVISIRWPPSVRLPPLEAGKTYQWTFTLICDPEDEDNSGNPVVRGRIRLVEPNLTLKEKLEKASSPRDRVLAYAAAGIWYDALNTLAQLRRTQPNDPILAQDWQDLLQSVGLQTIAGEPLLEPVVASDRPDPNISSEP